MAGGSTLLMWSVQYTTATNAALFSASQPIATAFLTWLVLRGTPAFASLRDGSRITRGSRHGNTHGH